MNYQNRLKEIYDAGIDDIPAWKRDYRARSIASMIILSAENSGVSSDEISVALDLLEETRDLDLFEEYLTTKNPHFADITRRIDILRKALVTAYNQYWEADRPEALRLATSSIAWVGGDIYKIFMEVGLPTTSEFFTILEYELPAGTELNWYSDAIWEVFENEAF